MDAAFYYWRFRKMYPPKITLPWLHPGGRFGPRQRYMLAHCSALRSGGVDVWMVQDLEDMEDVFGVMLPNTIRQSPDRERVFDGLEIEEPDEAEVMKALGLNDPAYVSECGLEFQRIWTERARDYSDVYNFNEMGRCLLCKIHRQVNFWGHCEDCVTYLSIQQQESQEKLPRA